LFDFIAPASTVEWRKAPNGGRGVSQPEGVSELLLRLAHSLHSLAMASTSQRLLLLAILRKAPILDSHSHTRTFHSGQGVYGQAKCQSVAIVGHNRRRDSKMQLTEYAKHKYPLKEQRNFYFYARIFCSLIK